MEHYWNAIRTRVCSKCIDGDRRGGCLLPADQSCALREFLPQVVQTVHALNSDSFDDYVGSLRVNVCSQCSGQKAEGLCVRRDSVECPLDRYYALVIQVIEETTTPIPILAS